MTLDADSRLKFVGRTRDYLITEVSEVKAIDRAEPSISVGDEIRGLRIGAIKCSFHWRDASYGGDQYMWRGRWACQAGRSRQEVEQAVTEDGGKRYDYLHVAPVRLP